VWLLAWAACAAAQDGAMELPEEVVTATRMQTRADDSTASVSVVSGKETEGLASDECPAHRPACGALLGKTFGMIGRQLAENYEQVRLAAVLTAQACPSGCHRDRGDRAIDVAVEIVCNEPLT